MEVPVAIKSFFLNQEPRVLEYFVDTVQYIYVNEHITENRISTSVEKKYIKKDDQGCFIGLYVTSRKQSNLEGMLAVEDRLSVLFEKLILYVEDHGKIKTIVNLKEIKQNWYDKKEDFKKEFKDQIDKMDEFLEALDLTLSSQKDFIQIIEKSDVVTLILPPVYDQKLLNTSILQKKVYDSFFGDNDVSLLIDTFLIAENELTNGYQIGRSGEIDYATINLNAIRNFFRENYNNKSLPVKLDVAYLETIDLDKNNDVDEATLMMGVEIKDQYQFRQISKTKKIN